MKEKGFEKYRELPLTKVMFFRWADRKTRDFISALTMRKELEEKIDLLVYCRPRFKSAPKESMR